jgi:hypothetical protein
MANRYRHTLAAAILGPLLLAASPALAQDATVYGNEADYDAAAVAPGPCIDFNGSTGALVSGASFSADVTFGSPEAADTTQVNWSSDAISDAGSVTAPNGVGPMDGTFTATQTAFKLTFLSNANAPTVDLYAEDATLIGTFAAPNAPGFFGVVSTTPIKRFVITPNVFAGTEDRDRFFIDDFCLGTGPAVEPPPEADLATMCHELDDAVAAADGAAFRGKNRQHALANKLRVVCRRIESGDAGSLCAAKQKLTHDLLPKMDGEGSPKDWVVDATVQADLEAKIDALVAALDDAIEAAGGCPSDPADDDGDDGEDGGDGGAGAGGPSAQGKAHGRGHNK